MASDKSRTFIGGEETPSSSPSLAYAGRADATAPRPQQSFSRRGTDRVASPREAQKRPRRIRRNALKHGLTIPVSKLPYFQDQITAWYQAILDGLPHDARLNEELKGICYEIAVQSCELRRIAEMKRVLSSERLGPAQLFSKADVIHLMTIIEGFIIPPRTTRTAFDARAISMLYRLFGVRRVDVESQVLLGIDSTELTLYQIRRIASFERYENRASVRLRKAVKRLMVAMLQAPDASGKPEPG